MQESEISNIGRSLGLFCIYNEVISVKKGKISFHEYRDTSGAYCIRIDNAMLCPDAMEKIKEIIRYFAGGPELFFGHYRQDGMYLSKNEFLQYSREIPVYFSSRGRYAQIDSYLTVCCAPNDTETLEMLQKVFPYYLETTVFCPKVDWETFTASYGNYMDHGTKDYAVNGFTDLTFSYVDSGDFVICFDPKVYDPEAVREQAALIMQ